MRADLDPIDLGRIGVLPSCWLVEHVDGDFQYRIAGDKIIEAFNQPLIKRSLKEILDPDTAKEIGRRWALCLDTRKAYINKGYVSAPKGYRYLGVRVGVPLLNTAGDPTFVLGYTIYREVSKVLNEPLATSIESDNLVFFDLVNFENEVQLD